MEKSEFHRWLTTDQVSQQTGLSLSTVIRWSDKLPKRLMRRTPGGHRRFSPEAVRFFYELYEQSKEGQGDG